jgi:hypothetical protein
MLPSSKPRRQADYRLEMLDNELLIFHPSQATICYCNETASLVWQLCDGKRTVEEVTALLRDAFPEAADTIAGDVEAVLQQFAQHDVIEFI